MKKFLCIILSAILLCGIFTACQKGPASSDSDGSTNENDNISDLLSPSDSIGDLSNSEKTDDEDLTPEDMAAAVTEFPSFAYRFALSEKDLENEDIDGIDRIEYNGEEINLYCKLTVGGYSKMIVGIRAFINGIAQSLFVANETTDMICTEIEKNESEIVKLTFVPNIGKNGDIMELSFDLIPQPDVIKGEDDYYRSYEDGSGEVGNISLVMNTDSSNEAEKEICDKYSDLVVSKVNNLIYQSYTADNGIEERNEYLDHVGFGIYENIDDFVYIEETDNVICNSRCIKTTASENAQLTINLHGKPGKYRICFLLNGEIQDVFDGKRFTDVTVERNMQTELKIHIDTSKLSKNNKVCFYAQELDDEFNEENHIVRTDIYQLIIVDAK